MAAWVLHLFTRRKGKNLPAPTAETSPAIVECDRCHTLIPFYEYLSECPLPSNDICADCERRSRENCAACQLAWLRANPNFRHICRECRDIVVPA